MPLAPRSAETPEVLRLSLLRGRYAICRLPAAAAPPEPPPGAALWSLTRSEDELSVVLPEEFADPRWRVEAGYRCFVVQGPLPFSAVGILARLAGALAGAGVPLFAISTFDTDYLLVPDERLAEAAGALQEAGCQVG